MLDPARICDYRTYLIMVTGVARAIRVYSLTYEPTKEERATAPRFGYFDTSGDWLYLLPAEIAPDKIVLDDMPDTGRIPLKHIFDLEAKHTEAVAHTSRAYGDSNITHLTLVDGETRLADYLVHPGQQRVCRPIDILMGVCAPPIEPQHKSLVILSQEQVAGILEEKT